jgi:hypothetical protein
MQVYSSSAEGLPDEPSMRIRFIEMLQGDKVEGIFDILTGWSHKVESDTTVTQ